MSATTTSPAWKRPGATTWPTLSAWNVTVARACTADPSTLPVEASTPEGRSTDTTGTPAAFTSAITRAASDRGFPLNPVPKSASTTTSAGVCSSTKATPASRARASMTAESPAIFSSEPTMRATERLPARASSAATRSPSPPFAPVPQTTAARSASGKRVSTSCATAVPARSINSTVSPGYAASAARISSAV